MLRLPEAEVRVIAPEVGGGFGSKLNVYAEEALVAYLAQDLKRPVKWIEARRENFSATIHGRGQVGVVEAAVKKDGTVLGLRYKVVADIGAYTSSSRRRFRRSPVSCFPLLQDSRHRHRSKSRVHQ